MPVVMKMKKQSLVAMIKGEIDHHTAPALRDAIDDAILAYEDFEALIIDFAEVTFMDSSGVGLVMGRFRLLKGKKKLEVINLSPRDACIMRMSGIEKIAKISERSEVKREVKREVR